MNLIENYYIDRKNVPVQKGEKSPFVMAFNISKEDINRFCKSKLSDEDKERFKHDTFYPIEIRQMADLSWDVVLGVLKGN